MFDSELIPQLSDREIEALTVAEAAACDEVAAERQRIPTGWMSGVPDRSWPQFSRQSTLPAQRPRHSRPDESPRPPGRSRPGRLPQLCR